VVKAFEAKKINPEAYTLYSYAVLTLELSLSARTPSPGRG
jgi:hypothetical protein